MAYKVTMKRRLVRAVERMPKAERQRLKMLLDDLAERGPVQPGWRNYSALSATEYHCHLSYHWVACWRCEKGAIEIEVYYAGSRENAPY